MKDPPILILDEATSALDADTEGKVMRALDDKDPGRLTFETSAVLERVAKHGDIFEPVLTLKQKLP